MSTALLNKNIVVTRPLAQAQNICEQLEVRSAQVIHFPSIQLQPPTELESVKNVFEQLATYNFVIFISANAVEYAFSCASLLNIKIPIQNIVAIGAVTKKALKNHGIDHAIVPINGSNSEALLERAEFNDIQGQKILIMRGMGGREFLKDGLTQRGANVDYAEVYQRVLPDTRNPIDLSQLELDSSAVLIYSSESLQNLWSLCNPNERDWLKKVTIVLGSSRIAEFAASVGVEKNSIIAENPMDESMLTALLEWSENTT